MVMDATHSPQSVGQEFVRQYYTLLNKAPNHLHRFYNNHSSFVHGGLEPHNRETTLVVGQKQIYTKIQQLNFRDCHAKISQVDAQSTLGSGVVVQVTGELSNDGQPMRRFTQTFVLAAQSPRQYYVHNDIFRYQDFYSEDEGDGESRSENDEEQDVESVVDTNPNNQMQPIPQQLYYPVGAAPAGQNVAILQSFAQPVPQMNGVVHEELQQQGIATQTIATPIVQQQQQQQPPQQPIPTDSIAVAGANLPQSVPIIETVDVAVQPTIGESEITAYNTDPTIIADPEQNIEETVVIENTEPIREEILIPKNIPAEPKTYANLFKSEITSGISFASAMSNSPALNASRPSNINTPTYSSRTQDSRSDNISSNALPQRSQNSRPIMRERRSSNVNQYGDNHQLFLGNVPHHATEDELTVIFSKFGTVVELRINSKSGPKIPGVRAPPNYGFITYEDPESVQKCLAHMPLYFPDNSPDGQKLNVEEKKTRMRSNDNGLNRNMSGGPGSGGNNGGPRLGGDRGGMNRDRGSSSGGSGGGGGNNSGMLRSGPPSGGPRGGPPSGTGRGPFNRNNDNRGGAPGGGQSRGGNGNGPSAAQSGGGGNSYGGSRR